MAREAGLHIATDVNWMPIIGVEYAERFAALVAAAEREACAKLIDDFGTTLANGEMLAEAIRARNNQ
jgi:hypothetical protein